ncbi:sensor histidine kinase [Spongiactinospora sp. TRM90649]|uniref:sensor histidine kinase n=1 Tax=Spongiactinospora sp. TRM90649 TaxID=3031114 RepID=UPI0023F97925|nr:sensor histidine kinase [Spongiactinospora sp. TRM90649]MDF5752617.1 sensor histidine kinase [Spongiactinospora sp. TRM90649]
MFVRLRAWGERHPRVVDAMWVAPLAALCYFAAPFASASSVTGPPLGLPGYLGLTTALLLPLFWRRSYPRAVFATVALLSFAQWAAGLDAVMANASVLIAMYSLASLCPPRWAVAAGLVSELGMWLALGGWNAPGQTPFASSSVFVVAIWLSGIYANTRRRYLEGLEERAERAERERDQQAIIAAAAERARIARELHDVVAHNVSVIIVQADGAAYAIDGDPEQARRAVQTISSTGRQALAEMRRLVGVLRQDDPGGEEYAPQPGLAQIDELVTQVRSSGLPVRLRVTGTPEAVPAGEQLTVYRIVQEALTNTLKHGGPDAEATVELGYGGGQIRISVADDGRGAGAPRPAGGHGLVGMRERVTMYGGRVHTGPRPGGGFRVEVTLPVPSTAGTMGAAGAA